MNIFVLDTNINTCAKYHCDKHVVKMITEYVQLISTALATCGLDSPYRPTHKNHPCSIWTRTSLENYQWLWRLADELGKEYTHRYGKVHLSHQRLLACTYTPPLTQLGLTQFANATSHKDIQDVIEAYRSYYKTDKARFARWTNRPIPQWFNTL